MIEAEQILEAMFVVAFSSSDDKIIDTNEFTPRHKSREFFREKIRESDMTLFNIQFNEKNIEQLNTFDIGIYEKEIEEFNCIRSFKEWTKSISNRCKIKIQDIQGIGDNAQFEIKLEAYIVNAMKLFPCWSSIMVSSFGYGDPIVSSSRVESNFNQLKIDFSNNK